MKKKFVLLLLIVISSIIAISFLSYVLLVIPRPETFTIKAHSETSMTIYCFQDETITCSFNAREESKSYQVKDPKGNLIYDSDRPWISSTEILVNIDGVYTFIFRNDSDDDSTVTFSYETNEMDSYKEFYLWSNSKKIIFLIIIYGFCILVVIGVWWQSGRTYDKYEMTAYDWDKEGEKKRKHG